MYILGQLIHNNQLIHKLEKLGIKTLESIPDKLDGICIIRTHGVAPQTLKELEEKGCKIIDATCPDVKHVQDKAMTLAKEGYDVVVIGKADHPEVIAIKAYADLYSSKSAIVISDKDEAAEYVKNAGKPSRLGIVIQTTQKPENYRNILNILAEHAKELKIYNTICPSTNKRQAEAKELAEQVDLMIVVGSRSSANTTHLAEILSEITDTIHIETHEELELHEKRISYANKIGVTAGASTPEFVINKVVKKIGEQK